jgi:hypothetical protein
MGTRPEEIRQEITATRAELAADVDRLAERTSPARIMRRRAARVRRAAHTVRERVMGTPTDIARKGRWQAHEAVTTVRDAASEAAETVKATPQQALQRTQGNPLAAGVIAFGTGVLAAAVIPGTRTEQRTVGQVGEQAAEVVEPIKQAVRETGQAVAEEMKGAVREAAQQVRQTAAEAAKTTGQEARDQARQVSDQSQSDPRPGSW